MNEKESKKLSYTERKESKKYIGINLNCNLIGIWGTLKKACEDIKETDVEFPSYWTLARRTDENPIELETKIGKYSIHFEKPK
jgi:hypothetical protein